MQAESRILLDTNVLVYAIDRTSIHHEIAKEIVRAHLEKGNAAVSCQNLAEFVFVVTEKNKVLSVEQAKLFVRDLAENAAVLSYSAGEVTRASEIKNSYGTPFFDALLVATMEKSRILSIITANEKDFKKISWLAVTNPFKKA